MRPEMLASWVGLAKEPLDPEQGIRLFMAYTAIDSQDRREDVIRFALALLAEQEDLKNEGLPAGEPID